MVGMVSMSGMAFIVGMICIDMYGMYVRSGMYGMYVRSGMYGMYGYVWNVWNVW